MNDNAEQKEQESQNNAQEEETIEATYERFAQQYERVTGTSDDMAEVGRACAGVLRVRGRVLAVMRADPRLVSFETDTKEWWFDSLDGTRYGIGPSSRLPAVALDRWIALLAFISTLEGQMAVRAAPWRLDREGNPTNLFSVEDYPAVRR